ncbi:hypothetical protein FNV43_RR16327 [Rhamnella rubrinervis]|uniref:Uncharacterized protein n=1 Tax=Rhamnella rubrinervis TaxID=2594499 RepID=A0A8K0GYK9_9ROSA|nr:hypothetical protein FNV43_RR16327 [Rhamnella rubrinervis]
MNWAKFGLTHLYPTRPVSKGWCVTTLVSRFSEKLNLDGAPYSLVLEPQVLSLNYSGKNYPRPLPYDASPLWLTQQILEYKLADNSSGGTLTLGRPKYKGTSSFLRLEIDGNLKIYTYNDKLDYDAWEVTFSLFDRESKWDVKECQLPERCGSFGLCEDNQCVACPSSKGLFGWSKSCEAEKVRSYKASDFH